MLTMLEMVENYIRSFYLERKMIPVVHLLNNQTPGELSPEAKEHVDHEVFRMKLLLVERAMADFLGPPGPAFSQVTEQVGVEAGVKL